MLHRGHAARGFVASLALFVGGAAACNSITGVDGLDVANGRSSAGGSSTTSGHGAGNGTGGTSQGASSSGGTSGNTSSGNTSSGGTSSGATSTSSSTSSTSSSSTSTSSGSTDPAQLCVDTINMFRATQSLPAYTRNTANESCVAMEASVDDMHMTAHWDVTNNNWPCWNQKTMYVGQDECPGWSDNPLDPTDGIVKCLTQMWGEKDLPQCTGCDSCDVSTYPCTNCPSDTSVECGHYVNMKTKLFTTVACGFDTTGWYAQDFQ